MKNEFGLILDANGYAPSIIQIYESDVCLICEASGNLARHEIFNGNNRQKSKAYGLWVSLCPRCHYLVHSEPEKYKYLKQFGQIRAMANYNWTAKDFRDRFGKNYIEEISNE